ncbi:DNA polymerase III subunit delta' [Novacetimonas maltaceti]|uniref:DNA polymerase III subunit delta n=1 Tax=Novacetimonas maltaceti TaxID=1203393 RepID=A0A2S3W6I0_9PROT|nr:DNA polymerase III subunit delta' [Novacetimonas maltaceti]POF64173.1 DNA polymerase III subunit delta' [Novacetimonas maltaceti]PYD61551.1 DNA polymerase III subunit delta' [Novacetimonas maltaceti]
MTTPRERTRLHGHEAAWQQFISVMRSGRLHHAWLLTGVEGIGKTTMAFMMARALLNAQDHDSPVGRRITAGTHADLLVVGRGVDEKTRRPRREIVGDDVRPIGAFLRRTAAEGGWRVVIVDGAEYMNRTAANAILKILEEPPTGAILILTCAAPGRLLPTIRSRCRTLDLAPLSPREVRAVLMDIVADGYGAEDIDNVIALAHGSAGRALSLLQKDATKLSALVEQVMRGAARGTEAYRIAGSILESENGFSVFFDLLCDAISTGTRELLGAPSHEGQPRDTRPERMAGAWQDLVRLRAETENFNLDKQQALLSALARVNAI